MTRKTAAEKERSHTRIIEQAATLFRQRGLAGTSVSDVMKAADLTHGGFYRHFKSKDELVQAALGFAISDAVKRLENTESAAGRAKALEEYVARYLSMDHVRNVERGCPIAALSGDAGRSDSTVRQSAANGVQHVISLIARAIGDGRDADDSKAKALFSLLVGTVSLARVCDDDAAAETLLHSGWKAAALVLATSLQDQRA